MDFEMDTDVFDFADELRFERQQALLEDEDEFEFEESSECESCGCLAADLPCGCVCFHSFPRG